MRKFCVVTGSGTRTGVDGGMLERKTSCCVLARVSSRMFPSNIDGGVAPGLCGLGSARVCVFFDFPPFLFSTSGKVVRVGSGGKAFFGGPARWASECSVAGVFVGRVRCPWE